MKDFVILISSWIIPFIIMLTLIYGLIKKIPVYETFVDGAKDGLKVSFNIIPYLIAMIVAISMLRASGAIELLGHLLSNIFNAINVPVDVLPIMVVRSLSGSAVLGLLSDIATNCNPDSYTTKLAAIMVGSSETTFYVLSVYFGAVGVKKFRNALCAGVFADIISIVVAILVASWLFL